MQTMKNDFMYINRRVKKKSFTHFSKHFPHHILNLHINAQCPHLSNNIQHPLQQEMPVLLFSLNKHWLYIQRYESGNCSNNDMTFRAWNKEINRPHLTSKGLGSISYFLNSFHMKQHFKKFHEQSSLMLLRKVSQVYKKHWIFLWNAVVNNFFSRSWKYLTKILLSDFTDEEISTEIWAQDHTAG